MSRTPRIVPDDTPAPAEDTGAAQDHHRDHIQLDARADVGFRGGAASNEQDRREGGGGSRERVEQPFQSRDRNAAEAGSGLVVPDGIEEDAERRPRQCDRRRDRRDDE